VHDGCFKPNTTTATSYHLQIAAFVVRFCCGLRVANVVACLKYGAFFKGLLDLRESVS
jgi:hypothetical protein